MRPNTKESIFSLLRLNSTYRQLLKDNENLQLDHKNLKSQLNSAKLDQTKLEAEFSKLKEQYQQLDITSTKLTNQCEVMSLSSLPFRFSHGVYLFNVSYFKTLLLKPNMNVSVYVCVSC